MVVRALLGVRKTASVTRGFFSPALCWGLSDFRILQLNREVVVTGFPWVSSGAAVNLKVCAERVLFPRVFGGTAAPDVARGPACVFASAAAGVGLRAGALVP